MIKRLLSLMNLGSPPRRNAVLFKCLNEINANVERFFVVEQRQFITEFFDTAEVEQLIKASEEDLPREVLTYQKSMEAFNSALKEAKDFEAQSYAEVAQRTRAIAEVLHDKKEKVEELFKTLRPIIMSAQRSMRDLLNVA